MVLTFEQEKELQELKHKHKLEEMELMDKLNNNEHERKTDRLHKMLTVAKAGGVKFGGA